MKYSLPQITSVDADYPADIDFSAPLTAENLTEEDLKQLAPKKRTRGENKANQEIGDGRSAKKGFCTGSSMGPAAGVIG